MSAATRPTSTVSATVMGKAETAVTKTVHATSASKGMWKDKPNISLVIPAFESEYPIVINEWPEGFRDFLNEGQPCDLVLERQSLKQGKDGKKDWHYWWAIKGVASSHDSVPAPPTSEPETRDATRASIERQKALDIAERFYSRYAPEEGLSVAQHSTRLLQLAAKLSRWLGTGIIPTQGHTEAVEPSGASTEASEDQGEGGPSY